MILNRTIQLKNLIQVHQPMALTNIKDHQEKQKEQQDLSNNILNQPLDKGSVMFMLRLKVYLGSWNRVSEDRIQ